MSVRLGKALLQLGANTEFRSRGKGGTTALSVAAKKTTREAAEFMKMLIEHDANVTDRADDLRNENSSEGTQNGREGEQNGREEEHSRPKEEQNKPKKEQNRWQKITRK
ncbi:hypothetical protein GGR51DRAFT_567077 [Nemania sp. FL0031]|nr:hypothetical protein GGR51DRAFT_567077 [Nemania sp. FL0031]